MIIRLPVKLAADPKMIWIHLEQPRSAEGGSTGTFTLHNLLPGTYDLYAYACSGNGAGQTAVSQFTANGQSLIVGPNDTNSVLTEGTNYLHLAPTVGGDGLLHISFTSTTGGLANLNGFQLSGPGAVTPYVVLGLSQSGAQVTLTWANGILLESTNLMGSWTTNVATSPYTFTPSPTTPQKFYKVQVQ